MKVKFNGVLYYSDSGLALSDVFNKIEHYSEPCKFKIDNSWVDTTIGRVCVYHISGILPEYELDKKGVRDLFVTIYKTYSNEVAAKIAKDLNNLFYDVCTRYGLSIAIDDLNKTPDTKIELNKAIKKLCNNDIEDEEKVKEWDTVINKGVEDWIKETPLNNPLQIMRKSGARVNPPQIRQMIVAKGLLSTISGKLTYNAIYNSLADGLSPHQYYQTCGPARSGLASNHFVVPMSGYMERQLINVARDFYIVGEDCGSIDTISIPKKYAIGRYTMLREVVLEDMVDEYDDHIEVLSPITCNQHGGICKKCAGINPATEKDYYDGFGIGAVAAQTLSERITQLALRGKHTSGSIQLKDYGKDIKSALSKIVKALGCVGGSGVGISDNEDNEHLSYNDFNCKESGYINNSENLLRYIQSIFEEAGVSSNMIWLEMIVRSISELVYVDGEYRLRSFDKSLNESDFKFMGVHNTIMNYPSWIKNTIYGYISKTFEDTVYKYKSNLGTPSEIIAVPSEVNRLNKE